MAEQGLLAGRRVLIGVSGGIAAYKINYLIRLLKQAGAEVRVVLTENGARFVSIPTLEVLTQQPVYTTLWPSGAPVSTIHIELGRWAECVIIAPATANMLAKADLGLADDLLSTIVLSLDTPILFAPAMNDKMYENPVVQAHMRSLAQRGHRFIEPSVGELACDTIGVGRMAEPDVLFAAIEHYLHGRRDMAGMHVLVTAGPTREPLDPVRYLTNASSGRMGYALAAEAALRGAEVTLVTGPTELPVPPVADLVPVETAQQMSKAVKDRAGKQDMIIFAAAVCDYRPAQKQPKKIKKTGAKLQLELEQNEDIAAAVGRRKGARTLVGFALETDNEAVNAAEKIHRKHLDLIVINNPLEPGAGFGTDTNIVRLLDTQGNMSEHPLMPKTAVARLVMDRALDIHHAGHRR